jgi:hypothetical protein
MKIEVITPENIELNANAVYITIDGYVYYFDDSGGEVIIQRWKVQSESATQEARWKDAE